jgi:hypothetical protein
MHTLTALLLLSIRATPEPCARPEAAEFAPLLALEGTVAALCEGSGNVEAARTALTGRILHADLEVDAAIAALQEEQAAIGNLTDAIQSKRDARVTTLNVASGIFAAGAAVGTGLTLRNPTATTGTWITTVTSGIAAVLSIYAANAPARGAPPLRVRSNLLAPFFGRPLASGEYPKLVWAYLGGAPPGSGVSRREQLVATWTKLGTIEPGGGRDAQRRIDALCAPVGERGEADAALLQDRARMLGDVRAQIATMKAGLRSLLEVAEPRRSAACPVDGLDRLPLPPPAAPADQGFTLPATIRPPTMVNAGRSVRS